MRDLLLSDTDGGPGIRGSHGEMSPIAGAELWRYFSRIVSKGGVVLKNLAWALAVVLVSGCATTYQTAGVTGGYKDRHIAEDVYRVYFGANGFATRETAQTYWLYRASELTLEKGFDGFEILSPIALGLAEPKSPFVTVQFIYVPIDSAPKPFLEADIRLLKGPIKVNPPKVFDARLLKADLDPFVKGEKKCDGGNVCPHIKKYLQPQPNAEPLTSGSAA